MYCLFFVLVLCSLCFSFLLLSYEFSFFLPFCDDVFLRAIPVIFNFCIILLSYKAEFQSYMNMIRESSWQLFSGYINIFIYNIIAFVSTSSLDLW